MSSSTSFLLFCCSSYGREELGIDNEHQTTCTNVCVLRCCFSQEMLRLGESRINSVAAGLHPAATPASAGRHNPATRRCRTEKKHETSGVFVSDTRHPEHISHTFSSPISIRWQPSRGRHLNTFKPRGLPPRRGSECATHTYVSMVSLLLVRPSKARGKAELGRK